MASAIIYPRSEQIAEDICLKRIGSENKHKRGRKKTVTWPIDEKICEVRHFIVDDAPSFLGVATFAHTIGSHNLPRTYPHEAKRARFTSVVEPGLADVPPGFSHPLAKKPEPEVVLETSMAINVPWHCPDKFNLDASWLWARGEQSKEVALQHQREMRVFEAVYPRLASVPDSPAEPDERCKDVDNTSISEIPSIPIEEEVDIKNVEPDKKIIERDFSVMPLPEEHREIAGGPKPSDDILHSNAMAESVKYRQADLMSKADSNVAAVAAAACMVVKALGENDLVDETLLLAILKNPSLLKSLTSNQVVKAKSHDQYGDSTRQVSRDPSASSSGKLPTDHAAYLNASPNSVLAKWGEGGSTVSPFGLKSFTSGNTNMWQSGNMNPTRSILPLATSLSYDTDNTTNTRKKWMQEGVEIAPTGHKQIPDLSKNIPLNPSLQEPSLTHVYGPKDETRLVPSASESGVNIDNRQPVQTVATPGPLISTLSVQAVTNPNSSCSVLRTSSSTSEWPQKIPYRPLRRLVQNADLNSMQTKKTAFGVSEGRAKRFCMYFNSPRGCRNGGSCAFVHQLLDSELNSRMQ